MNLCSFDQSKLSKGEDSGEYMHFPLLYNCPVKDKSKNGGFVRDLEGNMITQNLSLAPETSSFVQTDCNNKEKDIEIVKSHNEILDWQVLKIVGDIDIGKDRARKEWLDK
jgi:hypothetical protein